MAEPAGPVLADDGEGGSRVVLVEPWGGSPEGFFRGSECSCECEEDRWCTDAWALWQPESERSPYHKYKQLQVERAPKQKQALKHKARAHHNAKHKFRHKRAHHRVNRKHKAVKHRTRRHKAARHRHRASVRRHASRSRAHHLRHNTPAANQAIARKLLRKYGWNSGEFASLVKLWNGESGWRATAHNPSSGAHGIPQSLPGHKMASAGNDWKWNPVTQIRWGLNYIRKRYGSPSKAWQSWCNRSPHWY